MPYLRTKHRALITLSGEFEDAISVQTEHSWPNCIVVPLIPEGIPKHLPETFRLRWIKERAKAYSDACGLLANILLAKASATQNQSRIRLEEAVNRYFGELFYPELKRETVRSRIVRAYSGKNPQIASQKVNGARVLDSRDFNAFLLKERNKDLKRAERKMDTPKT